MANYLIRWCDVHKRAPVGGICIDPEHEPALVEAGQCPEAARLWPNYQADSDDPAKYTKPEDHVRCQFVNAEVRTFA